MGKMRFATEVERTKAINELDETPGNLEKLNEIREADIGPEEKPAGTTDGVKPVEKPAEKPVEKPVEKPAESTEGQTYQIKDLKGYKSPEEFLKGYDELKATFERQTNFIREKLGQQPQVDPGLVERAERAERELAELKKGTAGASKETKAEIKTVQNEIQRIQALQDELEKSISEDPDKAFTAEYQKKLMELSRLQSKNIVELTGLYNQAQQEIAEARRTTDEFVQSSRQSKEEQQNSETRNSYFKSIDDLGDDELKLSKPSQQVEGEYLEWGRNVALAYFGRPPKDPGEVYTALEQLQLKNTDLMQKCQMIGVPAVPSQDVKRYMEACELIDYMDGYRKDPLTGRLRVDAQGKPVRLTRYDPIERREVPLILPDLKSALRQKRLEEGYYDKKADGSFQQGAESVALAAQRRDQGAVTLDTGKDHGQTPGGQEWAQKILNESDSDEVMIQYRRGNKQPFEEMNRARSILGMEPITFQ